jgi:hemerythrin superfamily protein
MPESKPRAASTDTASRSRGAGEDALALLKADHQEVQQLFEQYDELVEQEADGKQRQRLALEICRQLTVHAEIEEQAFYPVARDALGEEEDLVDEATVEHASAKTLIAQIQRMKPDEPLFDAKVKVLGEYIQHHVQEEEREMFPKLKKAGLDLDAIGQELAEMKARKLQAQPAKH